MKTYKFNFAISSAYERSAVPIRQVAEINGSVGERLRSEIKSKAKKIGGRSLKIGSWPRKQLITAGEKVAVLFER